MNTATPAPTSEPVVPISEVRELLETIRRHTHLGNLAHNGPVFDALIAFLAKYDPQIIPFPFSIEAYEEFVTVKKTHFVRTTNRHEVRILTTDLKKKDFPIAAEVVLEERVGLFSYTAEGYWDFDLPEHPYNLVLWPIPKPEPEIIGYVNIFKVGLPAYSIQAGSVYTNKEDADASFTENRIACLPIREGEGLEPVVDEIYARYIPVNESNR